MPTKSINTTPRHTSIWAAPDEATLRRGLPCGDEPYLVLDPGYLRDLPARFPNPAGTIGLGVLKSGTRPGRRPAGMRSVEHVVVPHLGVVALAMCAYILGTKRATLSRPRMKLWEAAGVMDIFGLQEAERALHLMAADREINQLQGLWRWMREQEQFPLVRDRLCTNLGQWLPGRGEQLAQALIRGNSTDKSWAHVEESRLDQHSYLGHRHDIVVRHSEDRYCYRLFDDPFGNPRHRAAVCNSRGQIVVSFPHDTNLAVVEAAVAQLSLIWERMEVDRLYLLIKSPIDQRTDIDDLLEARDAVVRAFDQVETRASAPGGGH